jgi:hypothetical protein
VQAALTISATARWPVSQAKGTFQATENSVSSPSILCAESLIRSHSGRRAVGNSLPSTPDVQAVKRARAVRFDGFQRIACWAFDFLIDFDSFSIADGHCPDATSTRTRAWFKAVANVSAMQ